jgi:hypothetical protein
MLETFLMGYKYIIHMLLLLGPSDFNFLGRKSFYMGQLYTRTRTGKNYCTLQVFLDNAEYWPLFVISTAPYFHSTTIAND